MPPKRRRGGTARTPSYRLGVRQVIGARNRAAAAATASNAQSQSCLMALLVMKWAWGEVPATFIQEVAWAAVKNGCNHPEVIKMSRTGASGRFKGNIQRDLEKMLPEARWSSSIMQIGLTIQMEETQASWDECS